MYGTLQSYKCLFYWGRGRVGGKTYCLRISQLREVTLSNSLYSNLTDYLVCAMGSSQGFKQVNNWWNLYFDGTPKIEVYRRGANIFSSPSTPQIYCFSIYALQEDFADSKIFTKRTWIETRTTRPRGIQRCTHGTRKKTIYFQKNCSEKSYLELSWTDVGQ